MAATRQSSITYGTRAKTSSAERAVHRHHAAPPLPCYARYTRLASASRLRAACNMTHNADKPRRQPAGRAACVRASTAQLTLPSWRYTAQRCRTGAAAPAPSPACPAARTAPAASHHLCRLALHYWVKTRRTRCCRLAFMAARLDSWTFSPAHAATWIFPTGWILVTQQYSLKPRSFPTMLILYYSLIALIH